MLRRVVQGKMKEVVRIAEQSLYGSGSGGSPLAGRELIPTSRASTCQCRGCGMRRGVRATPHATIPRMADLEAIVKQLEAERDRIDRLSTLSGAGPRSDLIRKS